MKKDLEELKEIITEYGRKHNVAVNVKSEILGINCDGFKTVDIQIEVVY